MAARATGSATISFGLVSIPIKLYTATSPQGISFHMMHKKCGTRVRMQLFCPLDKEVVTRRDTVKGFEYGKDQFVQFSEEELGKMEAEKTDRLDIVEFVPDDSVEWLYIADTHYVGPGKGGDRAYKLLGEAMERTKRLAVGRYWTHGKNDLVLLRPYKEGLVMHRVFYADEVRPMDEVERPGKVTFRPVEEELADKLIEQLSVARFKPEQFHDEYRDRVLAAVEEKVAGKEVTATPQAPQAQIIDLFEALKRSLSGNVGANTTQIEPEAPAGVDGAGADGESVDGARAATNGEEQKPLKKASRKAPAREKKQAAG
jgi:DNA end-binding protein Ku